MKFICNWCNKEFNRNRGKYKYKFCSLSCSVSYKNSLLKHSSGDYRNCNNCNKQIWVNNSKLKINKTFYCSKECYLNKVSYTQFLNTNIQCTNCGELIHRGGSKLNLSNLHFCTHSCYLKWINGKNHPRWKGGYNSNYGYGWKMTRDLVLQKNDKCKMCGTDNNLEVHHIIPYMVSKDNSLNNLLTLCKSCHSSLGNIYWNSNKQQDYFKIIDLIK